MYALAMTIDHCYWEQNYECYRVRQVEKEAFEFYFWKQGKASTSSTATAHQNKADSSLVASSTKNASSKSSLSPTPKKQPNTSQVDLSSKLARDGKLTSDEHKKYLENNLYLYYSAEDHKLQSLLRTMMLQQLLILQQLLLRNPWKNREQLPRLYTD